MRYFFLIISLTILSNLNFAYGQMDQSRLQLNPNNGPFYHGVASGDPLSDRVIIWTRVTTDLLEVVGEWQVATDREFTNVVQSGSFTTDHSKDFTVKMDVTGLNPNTFYYYIFTTLGVNSVVGRTKTLPVNNVDQYRIVFVSCSDMNIGYYNVYERIKERNDFDAIYHLGDYTYEYQDDRYLASGLKVRDVEPDRETVTLADYRIRYSFYRLDPKLSELHQNYPWVLIWDDHETANDSYADGAQNHQPFNEGPWEVRKEAAVQAYLEWMPIRENPINNIDISRSFQIGDLVEFYALETRILKRSQVSTLATLFPSSDNSSRGMIGTDQRIWLQDRLSNTTAKWKVMASPVGFAPLYYSPIVKRGDTWDGYPWERKQIVNHIVNNDIKNFVVISGDIHSSFTSDIPRDIDNVRNTNNYNPITGEGSMGVNFGGPAVSSGLCCRNSSIDNWKANNPHLKYANVTQNGYALLDITPEKISCDHYYVDTVHIESDTSHFWEITLCVYDTIGHLETCNGPTVLNGVYPPLVSGIADPSLVLSSNNITTEILGLFPNPISTVLGIQIFQNQEQKLVASIYDSSGKLHIKKNLGIYSSGAHIIKINANKLPNGHFILNLTDEYGNTLSTKQFIK